MPLAALFRWFWILVLAVIVINGVIYRKRLRRLEEEGGITPAESSRLLRILGIGLVGMCLGLWAIQLAAGWESPLCVHDRPLGDPFVLASLALTAVGWAALLAWIFSFGGAELVSRASPALGRHAPGSAWSIRAVRIGAVLIVVAGLAGFLMGRQGTAMGCDLPPAASPR